MLALHKLCAIKLHVVAEVIEPEFIIRAIGNIAPISLMSTVVFYVMLNDTYGHSQKSVDTSHPIGISPGEIIVDRDDMNASCKGILIGGER